MNFFRQRTIASSVALLLLLACSVTFYAMHTTSQEADAFEITIEYRGITITIEVTWETIWDAIKAVYDYIDNLLDGNDCNADGNGCSCDPCECES